MLMGILLPESVFPDVPDHTPLASAGTEAAAKACEVAKVAGPPLVATAVIASLVLENQAHVEAGQSAPVTRVTLGPGPKPVDFPIGRTVDSNDVVIQGYQRRQRAHWAAINSTMNMHNNAALWIVANGIEPLIQADARPPRAPERRQPGTTVVNPPQLDTTPTDWRPQMPDTPPRGR